MLKSFVIGPTINQISTVNSTLLPTASSVGFTATLNATVPVYNDVKSKLVQGVAYQVVWAFVGSDSVNGGYTITQSSSAAPAVTP